MSQATMTSMMKTIIPADLFDYPQEGNDIEKIQQLIDQCFPGATAMQVQAMDGDLAEATIPFARSNRALHGYLHGGAYFTVGDTLTAIMCMFHVERETQRMLTANASIRYLRPIDREEVLARARLTQKEGNRLDFVCDFFNEQNKRAAQAKFQYILWEPDA